MKIQPDSETSRLRLAPNSEWVRIERVIEHTGYSRATIFRYLAYPAPNTFPSHQPAGKHTALRFDLNEVDEWIRCRCTAPTPAQPRSVA